MASSPSPASIMLHVLYESNEERIQYLSELPIIDCDDIAGEGPDVLSRLASDYWRKLSPTARDALLGHSHREVRSCAVSQAAGLQGKPFLHRELSLSTPQQHNAQ